jgi:DME family drug/metabolite transporter
MMGNAAAFLMPISFAVLILVVRKYPNVDMVPTQFIAGVFALIIGYLMSGKIMISGHDIFLGFLAGFMQLGFGFILITIGAQRTPSAMVGIIMLTEAVLGPIWAWLFVNEQPPFIVLIGGSIVILQCYCNFTTYTLLTKSRLILIDIATLLIDYFLRERLQTIVAPKEQPPRNLSGKKDRNILTLERD